MSTGVSGVPVTWFVWGLVVWYDSVTSTSDRSEMPHDRAVVPFGLMMVAKAVATVPTATERLEGRTAAVTGGDRAAHGSSAVAKSETPAPKVPACRQTPDGLSARARTLRLTRPTLNDDQLDPPSRLRDTPPPFVPA